MALPAHQAADLVVIEPEIFAILKLFFDVPAPSKGRDFGLQRRASSSEDQVIRQVRARVEGATDEQGVPAIIAALMPDRYTGPVKETRACGAPLSSSLSLPISQTC
jgi:hypothetical protein